MEVIVSVAISSDGAMDDSSSSRLVLSCEQDWDQVHALRASCDAILVGAGTLRSDNPSLLVKGEQNRCGRIESGKQADITKIVISGSGNIDTKADFFERGECRKIVIVSGDAPRDRIKQLAEVATVISLSQITARTVIDALESFGIERLMIEGGAATLKMFLEQEAVDAMRLAVSPVKVYDDEAVRLNGWDTYIADRDQLLKKSRSYLLADMQIIWFERADNHYMKIALEQSRNCTPTATCYRVGAVIVTSVGEEFVGYTHETSSVNHAEEEVIKKAVDAGVNLKGATIYSTMEPCSERKSKPDSCSALIIRHGFSRAVFALYEPSLFAKCKGARIMADAGVTVTCLDRFAQEVLEINSHLEVV